MLIFLRLRLRLAVNLLLWSLWIAAAVLIFFVDGDAACRRRVKTDPPPPREN
jgi:hypothetical protein